MKRLFWVRMYGGVVVAVAVNLVHGEEIPKLPSSVNTPSPITLDCVTQAKTLPALELCRVAVESAREVSEEYNSRITRFCSSLVRFDGTLRHKAKQGRLDWTDYEDLKDQIQSELEECHPEKGDYFSPYRARMREYRQISSHIPNRRKTIVKGIGL